MLKYLGGAGGGSSAVAALPAFNAQLNGTTVSGLSSGAFFAVQMHVAFSDFITGAGVFAGGPFDCALGTLATAEATCLQATLPPDASTYEEVTDSSASDGDIDTTENLAAHNVFLFSGKDDTTVNQPVMNALDSYYKHYITNQIMKPVLGVFELAELAMLPGFNQAEYNKKRAQEEKKFPGQESKLALLRTKELKRIIFGKYL